jgi:hypothetical protein
MADDSAQLNVIVSSAASGRNQLRIVVGCCNRRAERCFGRPRAAAAVGRDIGVAAAFNQGAATRKWTWMVASALKQANRLTSGCGAVAPGALLRLRVVRGAAVPEAVDPVVDGIFTLKR